MNGKRYSPPYARRGGCADQVPLDSGADGAVLKFHQFFLGGLKNRPVRSFKGSFAAFLGCRGHPALHKAGNISPHTSLQKSIPHALTFPSIPRSLWRYHPRTLAWPGFANSSSSLTDTSASS